MSKKAVYPSKLFKAGHAIGEERSHIQNRLVENVKHFLVSILSKTN